MSKPKPPGFWWFLFYGRRRRGVPWLLIALLATALLLGLTFALPGADQQRLLSLLGAGLIALLLAGSLLLALLAWLRPRGRR